MHRIAWLFVLALVVGLVPAMADEYYLWTFNSTDIVATGCLDISGTTAVAGCGQVSVNGGSPVAVVLATDGGTDPTGVTSLSGQFQYNDVVTPLGASLIPPYPTNVGILFQTPGNTGPSGEELNIWYQNGTCNVSNCPPTSVSGTDVPGYFGAAELNGNYTTNDWGELGTFTLTEVAACPEPGAVLLLIAMLSGVGGVLRKRLA